MKTKKLKDILELLIEATEKLEEVRCCAVKIDLQKSDEEQFRSITNKGDLYLCNRTYCDYR